MSLLDLFPAAMVALNTGAAIAGLWRGDYSTFFYWMCAAGLTVNVTWFR